MIIEWNKVTWYSKIAAIIVFVGTFFLGFWLGTMKAEKVYIEVPRITHSPKNIGNTVTASEEISTTTPDNSQTQIGYIKKIFKRDGQSYIDIDYIQWLTGKDADTAFEKINPSAYAAFRGAPNGYVIQNTNSDIRTFLVQNNVKIQLATLSYFPETLTHGDPSEPESYAVSWGVFEKIFATSTDNHYRDAPYWVSISPNNEIVSIKEQVIP